MQETEILVLVRVGLGNLGIACSNALDDGTLTAIGAGSGKLVKIKLVGPDQQEDDAALGKRADALVATVSSQMAGQ